MSTLQTIEGATATYSPEDNKLRMRTPERLELELFNIVKAEGFRYAPKQGFFVAPMWTPSRENLLLELCGSIGDEDTSLTDRAEDRAERFEVYSDKRANDAEQAKNAADNIAGNIPSGQPVLIGHHSEKKARKDAQKIENNLKFAVKMWETSEYWTDRAQGAIRHAKYKERPDVRARRIKKLEKGKRKQEKYIKELLTGLKMWKGLEEWCKDKGQTLQEGAELIAGHYIAGLNSIYYPLKNKEITPEEAKEKNIKIKERTIKHCERWLNHYNNRIAYEKAMLAESGGTPTDQKKPEKGGAIGLGYTPDGEWIKIEKVNRVTVSYLKSYYEKGKFFSGKAPFDKIRRIMSKAEVDEARDNKQMFDETKAGFQILDMTPKEVEEEIAPEEPKKTNLSEAIQGARETLEQGIKVVVAPQLFPTPKEVAQQMIDYAGIKPGHDVLEPSAGTGILIGAMGGQMFGPFEKSGTLTAVEINSTLVKGLENDFPLTKIINDDFLNCGEELGLFDCIIMNPPFEKGNDIKHIKHAITMLKSGGRLVSICANGPRQRTAFMDEVTHWEDLPQGTFKNAGTMVNTALFVYDKAEKAEEAQTTQTETAQQEMF